jgi:single-strand DNA-binding protein
MKMLNKVILLGRMVKDVEIKNTPSGKSVAAFTIAVDRRFQKQGEEKQADFINCVAWGTTAEFVGRYFGKGQMIALVGSIQVRNYEDGEGKRHYVTEVIADEVSFAGDKKNDAPQTPPAPAMEVVPDDGDLPF